MSTTSEDYVELTPGEKPGKKKRGPGFVLLMIVVGVLVLALGYVGFYAGRGVTAVTAIERQEELTPVEYDGRPPPLVGRMADDGPATAEQEGTAAPVDGEVADVGEGTGDGEGSGTAGTEGGGQGDGYGTGEGKRLNPPVHFVLMGTDASNGGSARSDSLMVAHVSGDRKNVYIVSFTRDMWVSIPGRGKAKINAAYAWGGPKLTVRTLEQLLGVRMDHTVAIDFDGFIRLTDAVGGVTVYNPWASGNGRFPKGDIHIEGEEALAYVRERKTLPNGDLGRAHRQRTVVQAVISKILTPQTLANPVKFSEVVGRVADTVRVDSGMTNGFVFDLATSMRITGSGSIRLLQAPIDGFATIQGQAVNVVDQAGIRELSRAMATDTMDQYYAKHG